MKPLAKGSEEGGDRSVKFISGIHNHSLPLAGRSVAEVRKKLSGTLNIATDTVANVNGETVKDEAHTTLKAGDTIEFVKHAGEKGLPA